MQVLQANDGFLWADVTHIAESLWRSQEFELYAIYDDQSEHLLYRESEFEEEGAKKSSSSSKVKRQRVFFSSSLIFS